VRRCGLHAPGSGQGPVAGSCEHRCEPSGSIKTKEFLFWVTIIFSTVSAEC